MLCNRERLKFRVVFVIKKKQFRSEVVKAIERVSLFCNGRDGSNIGRPGFERGSLVRAIQSDWSLISCIGMISPVDATMDVVRWLVEASNSCVGYRRETVRLDQ